MAACAAVCALAVISCSSDDDGSIDAASLIGRWELYKEYDGDIDEWDYDFGEGIDLWITEFRADGSCIYYDDNGMVEEKEKYKLDGNILTFYFEDPAEDGESCRIEKLTASELVLAYDYYIDETNGKHCTDREFYKRID